MKFDFVYLGQTVLKYEVPLEIFVGLNELYEQQKKQLPKANKQLVGKIEDEVSLFYSGPNNDKMHQHSFISQDMLKWFDSVFENNNGAMYVVAENRASAWPHQHHHHHEHNHHHHDHHHRHHLPSISLSSIINEEARCPIYKGVEGGGIFIPHAFIVCVDM